MLRSGRVPGIESETLGEPERNGSQTPSTGSAPATRSSDYDPGTMSSRGGPSIPAIVLIVGVIFLILNPGVPIGAPLLVGGAVLLTIDLFTGVRS
jgi:hypothetical protein